MQDGVSHSGAPLTHVAAVTVEGRDDGVYLFAHHVDAARFAAAVEMAGGEAIVTDEPVSDSAGTDELVAQELADVTWLTVGRLTVDLEAEIAALPGRTIALSRGEFRLLRMLAAEPRRVFTREMLVRELYGRDGSLRALDRCAARLRRKLGVDGHRFVVNVWGVGFRLTDEWLS